MRDEKCLSRVEEGSLVDADVRINFNIGWHGDYLKPYDSILGLFVIFKFIFGLTANNEEKSAAIGIE